MRRTMLQPQVSTGCITYCRQHKANTQQGYPHFEPLKSIQLRLLAVSHGKLSDRQDVVRRRTAPSGKPERSLGRNPIGGAALRRMKSAQRTSEDSNTDLCHPDRERPRYRHATSTWPSVNIPARRGGVSLVCHSQDVTVVLTRQG
jgi:hypothetical protein